MVAPLHHREPLVFSPFAVYIPPFGCHIVCVHITDVKKRPTQKRRKVKKKQKNRKDTSSRRNKSTKKRRIFFVVKAGWHVSPSLAIEKDGRPFSWNKKRMWMEKRTSRGIMNRCGERGAKERLCLFTRIGKPNGTEHNSSLFHPHTHRHYSLSFSGVCALVNPSGPWPLQQRRGGNRDGDRREDGRDKWPGTNPPPPPPSYGNKSQRGQTDGNKKGNDAFYRKKLCFLF